MELDPGILSNRCRWMDGSNRQYQVRKSSLLGKSLSIIGCFLRPGFPLLKYASRYPFFSSKRDW
uniref:Uncharacterized protein n=1 Tax=viral metagenome TaxID=1070528 RepID=A0A6C0IFW2_9ZZZZ